MKNYCVILLLLVSCSVTSAFQGESLVQSFHNPPPEARPWVYWFIMDGNLSREGITADLEAMDAAGIGGVIIMEVSVGIPRGDVEFMSESWCALFKHAVEEAERLGLQITLNAGPGWTGSGGPWVDVQQSMQHLVASSVMVTGPSQFDAVLARPAPREPYFGSAGLPAWLLQAREDFYADVAVLAVPTTSDDARLPDLDEKALYVREPYSSKPGVKPYLPAHASYADLPPGSVIPLRDTVDLTDRLQADGRLMWDVPAGSWTVLRFGRRTTGANTRPAPLPGLGFECDKFDGEALDAHYDAYVGKLLRTVGSRSVDRTSGWTMLHIDSWEMGAQNWTARFREQFRQRRHYDPLPYLPVMTGRVVESVEVSERFLWDLRWTAQQLVLEQHARHLKELGRRDGFGLSIEPYDMNPTADMALGSVADVPMCEFWSEGFGFDTRFSCFEATSIAHTLGRPIVAAESFTATDAEAWQLYPAAMKNQGDWALCTGINRLVFHRFAHQPWLDRRPGMTMGPYGVHWDRTQTWWPLASAYHQYLARCQYLLRQGTTVADICYLTAEGAPHVFRPPPSALQGDWGDRRGFNFDGCTPETLVADARVEGGRIVLRGGAAYRVLVLPLGETMTPALLSKITQLVESGATVVGSPPLKSPSLVDYPQCDEQVQELAAALWGTTSDGGEVVRRKVGQGEIVWGGDLHRATRDRSLPAPIEQARWIWYPGGNPAVSLPPCTRYFRQVVDLKSDQQVRSARIQITADNSFEVWLNGRRVGSGDNFHLAPYFDVSTGLQPGQNVLAVAATNGGDNPNPAGLIAALEVEYQDGSRHCFPSDRQWQAAKDVSPGWQQPSGGTDEWVAALELGASDMAPWQLREQDEVCPPLYPEYGATAALLSDRGMRPDFESDGAVRYTHRRTDTADIYFVANTTAERVAAKCLLRVDSGRPELWDPVTGDIRDLPEFEHQDGRTALPLCFEPYQSYFVLFRRSPAHERPATPGRKNFRDATFPTTLSGPWQVAFDAPAGTTTDAPPLVVKFSELKDWTRCEQPAVRYYSGIATYRTEFDVPPALDPARDTILLELGEVHCLARVRLNGQDLGTVWCAPWNVEVTRALLAKGNRLEIEVANLWPNRLIGDAGLPAQQRVAWTTWNPYRKDSPLLPSGLLGPVRLGKYIER